MTTHRILWVDDRFDEVHDHVATLRQEGHLVDHAPSLLRARDLLFADFRGNAPLRTATSAQVGSPAPGPGAIPNAASVSIGYSIVFIDLMVGGPIPPELAIACQGLTVGRLNDGQALGQWLWQRRRNGEPSVPYAYFSNIPESYQAHSVGAQQELLFASGDARPSLILEKFNVLPSAMPQCLSDCLIVWGKP